MSKSDKIVGWHPVWEAVKSNQSIEKVWIANTTDKEKADELTHFLRKKGVTVQFVPPEKFNNMRDVAHQGVMAQIAPIVYLKDTELVDQLLEKEQFCILILDKITDVRNFGAICRSAECMGIDGIVIPSTGMAPINEQAVKSSAGAILNIPIAKSDNLKFTAQYLLANGVPMVACTEKTDATTHEPFAQKQMAIVMGSEDTGISPYLLKVADKKVKIPMEGMIASLNVSVACGIVMYEWKKQLEAL